MATNCYVYFTGKRLDHIRSLTPYRKYQILRALKSDVPYIGSYTTLFIIQDDDGDERMIRAGKEHFYNKLTKCAALNYRYSWQLVPLSWRPPQPTVELTADNGAALAKHNG